MADLIKLRRELAKKASPSVKEEKNDQPAGTLPLDQLSELLTHLNLMKNVRDNLVELRDNIVKAKKTLHKECNDCGKHHYIPSSDEEEDSEDEDAGIRVSPEPNTSVLLEKIDFLEKENISLRKELVEFKNKLHQFKMGRLNAIQILEDLTSGDSDN